MKLYILLLSVTSGIYGLSVNEKEVISMTQKPGNKMNSMNNSVSNMNDCNEYTSQNTNSMQNTTAAAARKQKKQQNKKRSDSNQ